MNIDGSPGVMRRLIAFGLTNLRHQAGLSQAEAAKEMRCSQGRIANIEGRRNLPRLEFVEKLLRIYGVEGEIPHYTELLELAHKKSWWEGLSDTRTVAGFDVFLGLEEGASQIDSFDPLVVPGLLQTERYAAAVIRGAQRTEYDLERQVALRLKRQEALTRPNPVHFWAVIDELALDRAIGDADVRREQYAHILEVSELPHVQVQIISRDTGAYPALSGPFEVLQFPIGNDPGVVYVETKIKAVWFEEPAEIDQYTRVMNHLRSIALDTEQSRERLGHKYKKEV